MTWGIFKMSIKNKIKQKKYNKGYYDSGKGKRDCQKYDSSAKGKKTRKNYYQKNKEEICAKKKIDRATNPIKTILINRKKHLKKKYSLTLEQYDQMFEQQNGVCAICGLPELNRRLAVDHNHKTGKIRGLLCIQCNVKLCALENKKFAKEAKKYLNFYS